METNRPKISIIVPVYKVEKYLDRCLQSLINQTIKDIEIILVDDGSPDNCPQLCDNYAAIDKRVRVVHKTNAGLGLARNSGLDIATGDFVAFVDSDDFVDLKMYETLYQTAIKDNLDTCYCGFQFYYEDGTTRKKIEITSYKTFIGHHEANGLLLDMIGPKPSYPSDVKYMMSVWKALYSRRLLEEEQLRFCSERQFVSEDIIFHIDYLTKAKRIGFLPHHFYYYCYNGSSLSNTYTKEKFERNKLLLTEVNHRLSKVLNLSDYQDRYYRMSFFYLRASIQQEIEHVDHSGFLNLLNSIAQICKDNFFQKTLYSYNYWKLPLKHRLAFFLIKYRLYLLIYLSMKPTNNETDTEKKYKDSFFRAKYKQARDYYYHLKRKPYFSALRYCYKPGVSIIASNCFAGRIYQDLHQKYYTPTLGLYFMYPDYIEFLSNLGHYLKAPVVFVEESKYPLGNKRMREAKHPYPVGLLDGKVEIHFLHYHTREEAESKWRKRCERVDMQNLIVIGSDQNLCSVNDINAFDNLPFERKFMFSSKDITGDNIIFIPEYKEAGEVGDPYREGHIFYKYMIDFMTRKYKINFRDNE